MMLKQAVLVLGIMLIACHPAFGGSKTTYGDIPAVVIEVHDGDTLKVHIPGWPSLISDKIGVRVYGVDTRELQSGATAARDAVRKWIPEGSMVWLRNVRRDKYFRILADVGFNCSSMGHPDTCEDLAADLIEQKFGVPYFGEKKKEFPEAVK